MLLLRSTKAGGPLSRRKSASRLLSCWRGFVNRPVVDCPPSSPRCGLLGDQSSQGVFNKLNEADNSIPQRCRTNGYRPFCAHQISSAAECSSGTTRLARESTASYRSEEAWIAPISIWFWASRLWAGHFARIIRSCPGLPGVITCRCRGIGESCFCRLRKWTSDVFIVVGLRSRARKNLKQVKRTISYSIEKTYCPAHSLWNQIITDRTC